MAPRKTKATEEQAQQSQGNVPTPVAETQDQATTVAKVAHEANRAWCETHGDDSQVSWADAPDWQKKSAVDGVYFHLSNPDAGDSASHDNWMAHKAADGWVYGETKDESAKTHPCMVPFDQLPQEQQTKDALFRAIVHAILIPSIPKQTDERVDAASVDHRALLSIAMFMEFPDVRARRKSWAPGRYLVLGDQGGRSGKKPGLYLTGSRAGHQPWDRNINDLMATDWEYSFPSDAA